jgi:hypothetical protein
MGERAQPRQRERKHLRAAPTTGVRDEPDTARIVLERRVVERCDIAPPASLEWLLRH